MANTRSVARAAVGKLTLQNVMHDRNNSEFYVQIRDDKAVLQYALLENQNIIDMQHTTVPPAFRGLGVAKLLAQTAFDYAVNNEYKMKLTCWYLKEYLEKNPKEEYLKIVAEQ